MENISGKGTRDRKQDHIDLAFQANMLHQFTDPRFVYEPMLAAHPASDLDLSVSFLGKTLKAPLWVSSMTGGTEKAREINHRLATACRKFALGMGLGSCRPLLESHDRLADFNVRDVIGPDLPLYANLGIAQIERLIVTGQTDEINHLIALLRADGLIIHVNPLQEWLQPEGDMIHIPPIETLGRFLENFTFPVIVKEVGQGMGVKSIAALLQLPIAALELAAHGGTNFSKLELLRSNNPDRQWYETIARLGHTAEEMINWINEFTSENEDKVLCRQFIISGGIKDFLDGYYWMGKLKLPSIYGHASEFLKYARESQEALDQFISGQILGMQLARTYLSIR